MTARCKKSDSFSEDVRDEDKEHGKGEEHILQAHSGIIMALFCSVFLSVTFLFVRLVKDISPMEFGLLRFIGTLLPSLPIMVSAASGKASLVPSRHSWMLLLLHGCLGTAGVLLYFNAFRYLPLADVCVIGMASPVVVVFLAWAIYREPLKRFNIFLVLTTIIGMFLISHPYYVSQNKPNTNMYYCGLGSAIAGVFAQGMAMIILRRLREVHFSVTLTIFSLIGVVVTTITTLVWIPQACMPQCGNERYIFLVVGGLSFGGQLLLTRSLQREYAGPIALVRTVDILLAYMWQIAFQHNLPSVLSIFGGIFIMLSVVLLAIQKWLMTLPEDSPLRRSLGIVTL
ncbi:solute carrier family 35 member G1-like [Oratosquilla oratoria]|uniref:solute carrier family 35 member G1-like n=1 Tax=Oratosquilla oratoria TaxID=337810 RepID=UPI003F75935B